MWSNKVPIFDPKKGTPKKASFFSPPEHCVFLLVTCDAHVFMQPELQTWSYESTTSLVMHEDNEVVV
jgi:hypothetical protein